MTENIKKAFQKKFDGSWSCVKSVTIMGPTGKAQIGQGMSFRPGVIIVGIDIVSWLESSL